VETDQDLQSGFRTRKEKLPTKKNKEISNFTVCIAGRSSRELALLEDFGKPSWRPKQTYDVLFTKFKFYNLNLLTPWIQIQSHRKT
jgi:hypothetical protein